MITLTGKLVCANDLYCDWFGGAVTPPNLPVEPRTNALLAEAGRMAWRDGDAAVAAFLCKGREMTGTVQRVGRTQDHLLWRWAAHVVRDGLQAVFWYVLGLCRSIHGRRQLSITK